MGFNLTFCKIAYKILFKRTRERDIKGHKMDSISMSKVKRRSQKL